MARETYDAVMAANIRATRVRKKLDQAVVVERMRALGFSTWHRQTLGKVERGERRVTAEEIFGLALSMEVSIPVLTGPSDPDGFVHLPNGMTIHSISLEHLAGRGFNDHAVQWPDGGTSPLVARYDTRPAVDSFGEEVRSMMAAQGWPESARPIPVEETLQQPVVAAIVVSEFGVLIERRHDGRPLWTFPAGEQEPDERNEDTAIREVKEETGLEITAGETIGERDHPKTGRHMIYMAGRPVRDTDVFVGDEAELAEVKWVTLAELDDLMGAGNIFAPVHAYLEREIGA